MLITKLGIIYLKRNRLPVYVIKISLRNSSNKPSNDINKYSKTVLLPKTTFPLKLSNEKRTANDLNIHDECYFDDLYSWQRNFLKGPEFILHDGPPYANGKPHMGHAINKILKDIILRYKIISGIKVHYVPGWDCHGLPIELKAMKNESSSERKPLKIREKASNFATETIKQQRDIFKSWGVVADWRNGCYRTFDESYVKNLLCRFGDLYSKGFIYRALKPVYWSPSSRTALAESELTYHADHKSTGCIVKFKLNNLPVCLDSLKTWKSIYVLVWTTTPWTLPANQAICFNPDLEYGIYETSNASPEYYIYCKSSLLTSGLSIANKEMWELNTFSGKNLDTAKYIHPLTGHVLPFLSSAHVVATKGTGLVHIAPAHGHEDFLIGIKHKLDIIPIVDEYGKFNKSAGPYLSGLPILGDGTKAVLNSLGDNLVAQSEYVHSYPYDWRTNEPVIIKASEQWFIDTDKIKNKAIDCLKTVNILPQKTSDFVRNAMIDKLKNRPYWCISRQRVWGVPIPVFYNKCTNESFVNREFIENACTLIDKYGTNFWWTRPLHEFFPDRILSDTDLSLNDVCLGEDIFDIWFDSGMSWSKVLEKNSVANLYLEGVDQITGWFQSSLLTSTALNKRSPFRNLYVHGFVVDDQGRKMSKSVGNVVDPQEIVFGIDGKKVYGVDVLRWWVAKHGLSDSKVSFRQTTLESSEQSVQKIRSVFRFLISTLNDFQSEILIPKSSLHMIDRYILHMLVDLSEEVHKHFDNYHVNKTCSLLYKFIINYVSALYCNVVKHRLYCEPQDSMTRRSAQHVIYQTLRTLNSCLAPILPHLTEEVNLHMPHQLKVQSVFKERYVIDPMWRQPEIEPAIEYVISIKNELNRLCYNQNLASLSVVLRASLSDMDKLQQFQKDAISTDSELIDILQVSEVIMEEVNNSSPIKQTIEINTKLSDYTLCPRCRRFNSSSEGECCVSCSKQLVDNDFRVELRK